MSGSQMHAPTMDLLIIRTFVDITYTHIGAL
jgi:hypothetical protein